MYLTDYLSPARVPGTTDDTSGFLAARTAAAGKTLVIPPGAYKISDVVEFTADNTRIEAHGAVIELVDDGSATDRIFRAIDCENFAWDDGKLKQPAATRTGLYGLLTLIRVDGAYAALSTDGGSSCGVWSAEGSNHEYRVKVENSKADGIHLSRGIIGAKIYATTRNTGDDAIGIVAMLTEDGKTYPQIRGIEVISPSIDGSTLGGGVAFVGCADSFLIGGDIHNTYAAGVKVTNDVGAGTSSPSTNVGVNGTLVTATKAGAPGFLFGSSEDCTATALRGIGNSDSGLSIVGATRLHVSGGKFRGNGGFGVYEASGAGNNVIGADLRGNSAGAYQLASAVLTSCVTA